MSPSYVLVDDPKGMSRDIIRSGLERLGRGLHPVWKGDLSASQEMELRSSVEFLIVGNHCVPASVKDTYPALRMISLAFTGYDAVEVEGLKRRAVALYYVPGYASDSVAELNLALALALLRRIPEADRGLRAGTWDRGAAPGGELRSRAVGIVGTGDIGLKTARLFAAVGCRLRGWSRSVRSAFESLGGRYYGSLRELCAQVDILVMSLPLSPSTRGLLDATCIGLLRPTSLLINTARAELVDLVSLVEALRDGRLAGAAIDVFEVEPLPGEHPLIGLANVLLTPHLGFKTQEALDNLARESVVAFESFFSEDGDWRARNRL